MPDPIGWFLGKNLEYFRPYKNQVEPGYKGHHIELIGNFLDHEGPFRTIEVHLGPY